MRVCIFTSACWPVYCALGLLLCPKGTSLSLSANMLEVCVFFYNCVLTFVCVCLCHISPLSLMPPDLYHHSDFIWRSRLIRGQHLASNHGNSLTRWSQGRRDRQPSPLRERGREKFDKGGLNESVCVKKSTQMRTPILMHKHSQSTTGRSTPRPTCILISLEFRFPHTHTCMQEWVD